MLAYLIKDQEGFDDIREGVQSSGKLSGLENARVIPLDVMIPNLVAKKAEKDTARFL